MSELRVIGFLWTHNNKVKKLWTLWLFYRNNSSTAYDGSSLCSILYNPEPHIRQHRPEICGGGHFGVRVSRNQPTSVRDCVRTFLWMWSDSLCFGLTQHITKHVAGEMEDKEQMFQLEAYPTIWSLLTSKTRPSLGLCATLHVTINLFKHFVFRQIQ